MNEIEQTSEAEGLKFIEMTVGIVAAYVSNNHIQSADLPVLIHSTYTALASLSQAGAPAASVSEKPTPAQIRKSITPDALISFIDGKPYKTLKRHLSGNGLTIETYRERYGLPRDYPSTAASYSAQRSELARSLGLGQKRQKSAAPEPEPTPVAETIPEKPRRVGRPRKVKEAVEA